MRTDSSSYGQNNGHGRRRIAAVPGRLLSGFADAALAERDRWVLWLPVLLGTGTAVYFGLPVEPPGWLGAVVLAFAALAAWRTRHRSETAFVVLIGMAAFGLGFAAAQMRTAWVAAPMLSDRIGPASVEGQVLLLERQPKAVRVTLQKPRISGVHPHLTPERVRLRLAGAQPDLVPGDRIRLRAVLTPPPPPAAPGAFDFQRQAYFSRLGAVGFSMGPAQITARAADTGLSSVRLAVEHARAAVTRAVLAALPGRAGAIAAALMTGDRSAIDEETLDDIRDSGLAHLLAISGLHIGLVAGIVFFAVRAGLALVPALALDRPIKKWAAVAAIAAAFAYAQLAGATVPTQRSFLMVGLVLAAVLADRRGLSLRLVAWAAAVVLLIQPEAVLSASFQLSFAAVVALIAAYEALARFAGRRARWRGWFNGVAAYGAGVALSTVIAGAATAPFAAYHFNHIALFGVAANLIAVPLTALWVMPWAVAAFVLMPLGLEGLALAPLGLGVDGIAWVAATVSRWPGGQVYLPAIPTAGLVLTGLGGLWLCLWSRRWRLAGVPLIAAGLASMALNVTPDVLIGGDGRLMAVKDAEGHLMFSSARADGFSREAWLRSAGYPAAKPVVWPKLGSLVSPPARTGDAGIVCDGAGCLYRAKGRTVALVRDPAALAEDCWTADVVVSPEPVRGTCPARGGVVDRFDLWRNGAHAIWLSPTAIRIESVNGVRGQRPWVLKKKRKSRAGA